MSLPVRRWPCFEACAAVLGAHARELGCEIEVLAVRPDEGPEQLVSTMRCPHGCLYWIRPTMGQLAEWAIRQMP